MVQKWKYDYNQYLFDLNILLNKVIESATTYDCIIGLSRGGLVAGVQLSHALDVPFEPLLWSTSLYNRDFSNRSLKRTDKKILVIDDICDSGKTLTDLCSWYPAAQIDTAVLIYNTNQSFVPTYYSRTIDRTKFTDWVDFWWESIDKVQEVCYNSSTK